MRILLTGASGFIGAHVSAELIRNGAQVRGFCRSEPPPHARVSEWVAGDVRDLGALERASSGCDAVIHTAASYSYARSDRAAMYDINVGGTRNVIQAAAAAGIRRSRRLPCSSQVTRRAELGYEPTPAADALAAAARWFDASRERRGRRTGLDALVRLRPAGHW